MLDLVSRGAFGHVPVHLLISAAEIGFVWDGERQGWIRAALPHLGMLVGPIQHVQSAVSGCAVPGNPSIFTTTYLFPPAGKEIKCC